MGRAINNPSMTAPLGGKVKYGKDMWAMILDEAGITPCQTAYGKLKKVMDSDSSLFSGLDYLVVLGFKGWLPSNVRIYQAAVDLSRLAKQQVGRYSIKACIEVLRYRSDLHDSTEPFKISDRYSSCLSRLIMAAEPDLKGLFRTHDHGGGGNDE